MKQFVVLLLLLLHAAIYAQNEHYEKPPVFSNCDSLDVHSLKPCFDKQVFEHVSNGFQVPDKLKILIIKGRS